MKRRHRCSVVVRRALVLACSAIAVWPATGQGARVAGFERGRVTGVDGWSALNGSLSVVRTRSYDGRYSARAHNEAGANQFQRVWYRVRWRTGSAAWFGMALYIPRLSDWCWWQPMRWDNYLTYGSEGDVGGLRISQGRMYLDHDWYGARRTTLIGPVTIPQARWFWVEVHQRFSDRDGSALTELYVDGVRRGRSTKPNSAGRRIDHIRYGNVAMASTCSRPSSIYFDRVSLTTRQLGPR
jgi:hypothetical protein